jgi:hypothetical protein
MTAERFASKYAYSTFHEIQRIEGYSLAPIRRTAFIAGYETAQENFNPVISESKAALVSMNAVVIAAKEVGMDILDNKIISLSVNELAGILQLGKAISELKDSADKLGSVVLNQTSAG